MGDFEKEPTMTSTKKQATNRVSIIALLMIGLAFLAPVASAGYGYGFDYFVNISAILWSFTISPYYSGFQFLDPFNLMIMIPFLLFRVGSTYQLTRYYQGKTSKGRARLAAVLSDGPILFMYILYLIAGGFYGGLGLNYPLPIMMIVGLLLLWRSPVREPTVPWEDSEEPKSWWEEKPEETTEPPADDQPW
jgi:hypothetical protein